MGELQYTILTEFGILMKLFRLINVRWNSKVCIGNLSDIVPIQTGLKEAEDAL
jgi:hypothetical protein